MREDSSGKKRVFSRSDDRVNLKGFFKRAELLNIMAVRLFYFRYV